MQRDKAKAREKVRIRYYEDNMSPSQHIAAYLVFAVAIGAILYIYYHLIVLSILGGLVISWFQEKNYAKLWQVFFTSISIKQRENPDCQRNHLPFRFRPEMTEFSDGASGAKAD